MGLAQAGMIRRKNSLSMLMQVLFGMVIGSLLWTTVGFSLAFGPSVHGLGIIGSPGHFAFLENVPTNDCLPQFAVSIPGMLFVGFQMMFALMAPLIVTGAWYVSLRDATMHMFFVHDVLKCLFHVMCFSLSLVEYTL